MPRTRRFNWPTAAAAARSCSGGTGLVLIRHNDTNHAEHERSPDSEMRPQDLESAIGDRRWWLGDRREELTFYLSHRRPECSWPSGTEQIVGTTVVTAGSAIGWLGLVFVAPALRGHGLGSTLTRAGLDCLHDQGSRSILLAATDFGRPIYEKLGFVIDGYYSVLPRDNHAAVNYLVEAGLSSGVCCPGCGLETGWRGSPRESGHWSARRSARPWRGPPRQPGARGRLLLACAASPSSRGPSRNGKTYPKDPYRRRGQSASRMRAGPPSTAPVPSIRRMTSRSAAPSSMARMTS
jgi:GNAT superfamily N-acetyltransferase